MSHPVTSTDFSTTTSDAGGPAIEPEGEGALALCHGLGRASVSGLDADPDRGRRLYVAAAVTETLRLEHFGPQGGLRRSPPTG